ncbi:helix-turn-helix domain-containing protein [Actinomadura oligospora]|uniref:helix-turn-helix domain-containing protein n=1 Tax=Actinomadura oligospora TaxID=111804 RepID=UPI003CCC0944
MRRHSRRRRHPPRLANPPRPRNRTGRPTRLTQTPTPPTHTALLVLVHLRRSETFAEVSSGFGVSISTAWRYVEEAVTLLSARSPKQSRPPRQGHRRPTESRDQPSMKKTQRHFASSLDSCFMRYIQRNGGTTLFPRFGKSK